MKSSITIGNRTIGEDFPPLVIPEIGINHGGDVEKAKRMVDDAARAGAEVVKFQCHVIEDEMVPAAKRTIPGNAKESIWDIMARCALTEEEDQELKRLTEALGMIYLSTPFSRAAADRLARMDVSAFKIGSGECNNYPLIAHITSLGKPIIISTGMNDLPSIARAVDIMREYRIPFGLMHCTSLYPTPYRHVRLGALAQLRETFPDAVIGLSDHTVDNYTCLGAAALGASLLERHFTSDKSWPGPDMPISMDPVELRALINGSRAMFEARGGEKLILPEEQPTIDFAYACVVSIRKIPKGSSLTRENLWVKRPGTGEIKAKHFESLLGKTATEDIPADTQILWRHVQ
ncbi:MAG: N-acetylneuraminate synthase family protein [Patescibacteria group bacterium]